MEKRFIKFIFLFLCFNFTLHCIAQEEKKKAGIRVSAGPVISFYKNNEFYTAATKGRAGFSFEIKKEIRLAGSTSLLVGLGYTTQGVTFNSYYFAPGHSIIYDENFAYQHQVRYSQGELPIIVRQAFGKENTNENSGYFLIGWAYRYVFSGSTKIQNISSSKTAYNDVTDITFEYKTLTPQGSVLLEAGFGAQKNYAPKEKAVFFEFVYKYGLSRLHYKGNGTSNNLFIKDSSLTINLGYKF